MPVSTTRSELLTHRLESLTKTFNGVEQGDVRALHRARVASRRLRELLPTLHLKDPSVVRKLGKRLRKVTTRLGVVRELDVLVLLIDELHVSRRVRSGALGRVGVAVAHARDEARERLLERLPIEQMRRIARKLEGLAEELAKEDIGVSGPPSAGRSWRWVIDARVAQRASRLTTALNDAGSVYLPERLHAARIALKKLRYAAELSAETAGDTSAAALRVLARGQELLGRMHDMQVLLDRVRDLQASLTPPNVQVWRDLDALVVSIEDDCRRLHGRYMRARDGIATIAVKWSGADKGRSSARVADSRSAKAG